MSMSEHEQRWQIASMLKRQRKLLHRRERERRNTQRLLHRIEAARAAKAPPPVLCPHERQLLRKLAQQKLIDGTL